MAAYVSLSLKNPDGTYTKCMVKIYDTPDKYGNNAVMFVEQTEEEKKANAKKTYLANGKVVWTDGSVCKPSKLSDFAEVDNKPPISEASSQKSPLFNNFNFVEKPNSVDFSDGVDDLPF
jgi:hypothetical protein